MMVRSLFTTLLVSILVLVSGMPSNADEKKNYELRSAAGAGKYEAVKKLISDGADVNSRSNRGYTALITAARGNFSEVVNLLIDADADVNAKDDDGDSALMFSVIHHNVDMMQKILRQQADCNITDNSGVTPLMKAVILGHCDMVRLFLSKRMNLSINLNAVDVNYFTALMYSAKLGRLECAEILMNAGADATKRSSYGETALSLAIVAGQKPIVDLLIPKAVSGKSEVATDQTSTVPASEQVKSAATPTTVQQSPASKSSVKKITDAWFHEAEEELAIAELLLERGKFKASCYHFQQSVEKALWSLVFEKSDRYRKNQEIIDLITRVQRLDWSVSLSTEDAVFLNDINKDRYPTEQGPALKEDPSKADAQRASTIAQRFIESVRVVLGKK